ncbi:MAG: SurA N-terminal domain-containing protein [Alphaproteobacteria bacterium]
MMEALRKGAGTWIAKIFIALLVLSFAVWGIADIFGGYGTKTVATVGDTEISTVEYQNEFQRELRAISNRLGRNVTIADARQMGIDGQVILRLIGDAALETQAKSLGLGVTGKAVGARLMRQAAFKDSSGKFDRERFYRVLQANNLSEQGFLERQRRALIMQQITGTVSDGSQPPKTLVDAANRFANETRKLSYITVPKSKLGEIEEPSAEKLRDYYNTHKGEFRAPEFRKVGLIELTPVKLAESVEVPEADIKAAFDNNKARFNRPERRTILQIAFPDDAAAKDAHAKLLNGADFMEVAKARGLTESDVNLGTLARDDISDKKISDAVFSLEEGKYSEPITGDLATVIAKITKIVPAQIRTLDEMRDSLRKAIASERAGEKILDVYDKIEDERAGGATLAEIAAKLQLKYAGIPAVDSRGIDDASKPVELLVKQPKALRAIFKATVGLETDPEETSDRGYIWYEVLGVTPERLKPFEDVKQDAETKWRETQLRTLLSSKGQELVDKLRGGSSMADLAQQFELEVKESKPLKRTDSAEDLPNAAIQQAFALKQGDFGSAAAKSGEGRVVFTVTESAVPKSADAKIKQQLVQVLVPQVADDLIVQYIRGLRKEFGVNINQSVFDDATTGRYSSGQRRRN